MKLHQDQLLARVCFTCELNVHKDLDERLREVGRVGEAAEHTFPVEHARHQGTWGLIQVGHHGFQHLRQLGPQVGVLHPANGAERTLSGEISKPVLFSLSDGDNQDFST